MRPFFEKVGKFIMRTNQRCEVHTVAHVVTCEPALLASGLLFTTRVDYRNPLGTFAQTDSKAGVLARDPAVSKAFREPLTYLFPWTPHAAH